MQPNVSFGVRTKHARLQYSTKMHFCAVYTRKKPDNNIRSSPVTDIRLAHAFNPHTRTRTKQTEVIAEPLHLRTQRKKYLYSLSCVTCAQALCLEHEHVACPTVYTFLGKNVLGMRKHISGAHAQKHNKNTEATMRWQRDESRTAAASVAAGSLHTGPNDDGTARGFQPVRQQPSVMELLTIRSVVVLCSTKWRD